MKCHDQNFVQRLLLQKEDALEYVIDCYLPLVKGIVYKVLSPMANNGMIEECVNDIFLSVWNNAHKFHGESHDFKKWIGAIAKFKAIDYYRKASRKREFSSHEIEMPRENSAEDELILLEDQTELLQLINTLEVTDRNIFVMKFFLGLKTEEISIKLGLSKTAVDNRIYRGRKKLHQKAAHLNLGGSVI